MKILENIKQEFKRRISWQKKRSGNNDTTKKQELRSYGRPNI